MKKKAVSIKFNICLWDIESIITQMIKEEKSISKKSITEYLNLNIWYSGSAYLENLDHTLSSNDAIKLAAKYFPELL